MTPPIRVFVGSGARHRVEETVFARSIVSSASRPIDVRVIDGDAHVLRNLGTGDVSPLPGSWRGRLGGATAFSFARFAAPELCGFEGRAIYTECDQLALGDIAELWDVDLTGAAVAAVPYRAVRHRSPFQSAGYLSSVVVFDNERCRSIDVVDITGRIERDELTYMDAICMTDAFVDLLEVSVHPLEPRWNELQRSVEDTAILHFTDMAERPWLHPGLPDSDRWVRAYLAAVDAGALTDADLSRARRAGAISRRVATLPRCPRRWVASVDHLWQRAETMTRTARRALRRIGAVVSGAVRRLA